jgi:hypothetical protein
MLNDETKKFTSVKKDKKKTKKKLGECPKRSRLISQTRNP